jgi:hypothetical protein
MRVSGPSNRPSPNLSPHRHPRADIFQGRFVRGAWDRPLGVRARPHGRANPTIRHFADRERKGSRRDASGALIQTEADRFPISASRTATVETWRLCRNSLQDRP